MHEEAGREWTGGGERERDGEGERETERERMRMLSKLHTQC